MMLLGSSARSTAPPSRRSPPAALRRNTPDQFMGEPALVGLTTELLAQRRSSFVS
jgi:hypothetical protein